MTSEELAAKTVTELRRLAAARGVPGVGKMRKSELVAALSMSAPSSVTTATALETPSPAASSSSGNAQTPAPAPAQGGADPGLPIPERYGRDCLVLMVQDPFHVFAYWEISPGTLQAAAARAGEGWAPVLLLRAEGAAEQREIDLRGGNYYLSVAPGGAYEAELALRARDGRLIPLVASNRVRTPAAGPSLRSGERWMHVDATFAELLERAGLPGSAGSSAEVARRAEQRVATWELSTANAPSSLALAQSSLGLAPSSTSLSSSSLHRR